MKFLRLTFLFQISDIGFFPKFIVFVRTYRYSKLQYFRNHDEESNDNIRVIIIVVLLFCSTSRNERQGFFLP